MSRRTKKMEPYSKDEKTKFKEEDFSDNRRKKRKIREEVKNANRTLKKGKRQELKRQLENFENEDTL